MKENVGDGDGVRVVGTFGDRGEEEGERLHVLFIQEVESVGAGDVRRHGVLGEVADEVGGGSVRGVVFLQLPVDTT